MEDIHCPPLPVITTFPLINEITQMQYLTLNSLKIIQIPNFHLSAILHFEFTVISKSTVKPKVDETNL